MKKLTLSFLFFLLVMPYLSAQTAISIADARLAAVGSTVTVEGIVLNGSELGNSRYMDDGTAGINVFNASLAQNVTAGDRLLVTGKLAEFNNLLQITDGNDGQFAFTVINSGNALPAPLTLNIATAYNETYESRLIKISQASFVESGAFTGNTNYNIADASGTGALRVGNATNIVGTAIPAAPVDVVGILGQYQATYQLLPRNTDDLGIIPPPVGETITIAEARVLPVGSTVTVKGIVLNGSELGNSRYMDDGTAGIGIFNGGLAQNVTKGDSIVITGQLTEFNNLLQITNDGGTFEYDIINSNNPLPQPISLSLAAAYSELYESRLVALPAVTFVSQGYFAATSGNYEVTDGNANAPVRVNAASDLAGQPIPTGEGIVTGIMSQYQANYQLLLRSTDDLTDFDVPVVVEGLVPIATARQQPENATVTVKGVVTNGAELGVVRYFQDATGGIAVYAGGSVLDEIFPGDSIQVTGQLTLFNGLLEIVDGGGDFSVTKLNEGNALPQPNQVGALQGFAEGYEAQLMRFSNMDFVATGIFSTNSTNYIATDGVFSYQIRVVGTTNIAGTPIPTSVVDLTGIMSDYNGTYQLLLRSLDDIHYQGNPPIFNTALTPSNITTTGFTVNFGTQSPGNTVINYGTSASNLNQTVSSNTLTTDHSLALTNLQPGQIYYVQATSTSSTGDASQSAIQVMGTVSLSSGNIKVYFNSPVNNSVSTGVNAIYVNNAIADTLINYINRAQATIDMCMYSFDNQNGILDALIAAQARGVTCRFVADEGINQAIINVLPGQVRVRINDEGSSAIMHNKFVVFDANSANPNLPLVWTGSTNFTDGQLNEDPNNVIILQDQTLARAYTLEFEEMLANKFGPAKTKNTPNHFVIGGRQVEAYFTAGEDARTHLINAIESADFDAYFGILALTRLNIAYAFADEADAGTYVAGIMDNTSDVFAEPYSIMAAAAGENHILEDNFGHIFHHKYAIIDPNLPTSDPLVWTGSYNWSNGAEFSNDENIVVVHDATIANIYFQEFVQRFTDVGGILATSTDETTSAQWTLQAMPNPANDVLNVRFSADQPTSMRLTLCNIAGQVVYTRQQNATQAETFTINTNHLPEGMYILNVNNQTKKVIIAR